ncbi:winged helix-turn-helix transcriptional regulator [Alsobacter sp. SYSU M60028]|uniref:Winged helix-turn-helix transcriptional regulator n=1 Tax=Alsobacter ponti TaxID=2962936 RepID=A0ABT1L855_9HYPH|nr:carbohydrate kinase [Alsobacter ponti]MCP8937116.1 winged helix-turn-helix transcriptional regulator [Alsobacter ponti]
MASIELGQQERAVLDAIAANPFAGQQEIATALGLARSTVAAHIVSLIQKGRILGRGYVLPEAGRVTCIGGAVLDRKYASAVPIEPRTSNPVSGCRAFGGVARNVAENLARLGVAASLVSIIGDDEAGRDLLEHLRGVGVDGSGVVTARGQRTAEYVAVLGPDSDLVVGVADMGVFDLFSVADIDRAWPRIAASAWVFLDCNLPGDVIAAVIARKHAARFKLAVNAVSAPKARRLPQDLRGIDLLFVNLDEARALLGGSPRARAAASALVKRGAEAVVLTRGSAGACVAAGQDVAEVPSAPASPVDVTGAGDALVAATLTRLLAGETLVDAVRAGAVLAALTTESRSTVLPDLSPVLLAASLDRVPQPAGN